MKNQPIVFMALVLGLSTASQIQKAHGEDYPGAGQENWLFQVPKMPSFGPVKASWAFHRKGWIWSQNDWVNLSSIRYPEWDTQQNPPVLLPKSFSFSRSAGKTSIILFSRDGTQINQIAFDKGWPLPSAQEIAQFQIRWELSPHVFLNSAKYSLPERQEILNCEAELPPQASLADSKKIEMCLQALEGLAAEDKQKKQWYATVEWPDARDTASHKFILQKQDLINGLIKRSRHVVDFKIGKSHRFSLKAGLTQTEKLPQIKCTLNNTPHFELIGAPPPAPENQPNVMFRSDTEDGCRLELHALPGDFIENRVLNTPAHVPFRAYLQFVLSRDENFRTTKTDFPEYHTGLRSHLAAWNFKSMATWRRLLSNRGESVSHFGGPGAELSTRQFSREWIPWLQFDYDWLRVGSSLQMMEIMAGVRWAPQKLAPIQPTLAILYYSLSGRNPGSSRLGNLPGIIPGFAYSKQIDEYWLASRAGLVLATANSSLSLGFDARVEFSKFIEKTVIPQGAYLGGFFSFSQYGAQLQNKLGAVETFTENRLQLGIIWGWAGKDYLDIRPASEP